MERLFVEFQQLDAALTKKHPGTGLGLALTRRIVEAQGGSVGVRSAPGEGSVFHAILPRRSRVQALTPPGWHAERRSGVPTVLVIEDDSRDMTHLVRTLADAGYAVDTATTGALGLAKLAERAYDAVLLDLLLPDMNGLDVLGHIRSGGRAPETPVIIVTIVGDRAAGFPVQDVLTKPIDSTAVLAALRRAGVVVERPGSVLVVDDDVTLLGLMAATLDRLGYASTCEQDGVAALLSAERERPVAVILDLLMPGMSGFEFLDRFRSEPCNRDVPVLIWTAKDLTFAEEARLREQAQAVHSKLNGGMSELLQDIARMLPRQLPASLER
jgi:CheY-like chemotaxis protein